MLDRAGQLGSIKSTSRTAASCMPCLACAPWATYKATPSSEPLGKGSSSQPIFSRRGLGAKRVEGAGPITTSQKRPASNSLTEPCCSTRCRPVRYHGILGLAAKDRAKVVPTPPEPCARGGESAGANKAGEGEPRDIDVPKTQRGSRLPWALLLKRVFMTASGGLGIGIIWPCGCVCFTDRLSDIHSAKEGWCLFGLSTRSLPVPVWPQIKAERSVAAMSWVVHSSAAASVSRSGPRYTPRFVDPWGV
jgi:hypothetical protein